MTKRFATQLIAATISTLALNSSPHVAEAHNTTGICWEDFSKNDFVLNNDYYTVVQKGVGLGWSKLASNGALALCGGTGAYDASTAANCWMWRHRCVTAYINVGADAHMHIPDYLGRLGAPVQRGPVQAHTTGYPLRVYMEQGGAHALVDLNYIQVKGTVNAILSVKDAAGTWWDSSVLTPNTADLYYNVTDFGWDITEAKLMNVPGAGAAAVMGGIYILTP